MPIDRVRLVHEWLEAAEFTAKHVGVSPSAIVAQAVLESGWGAAAIGNNVFGIRADPSWKGKVQYITTREVINGQSEIQHGQGFRDYDSVGDSFADHFKFLRDNSRYAKAGVFDPDNNKSDRDYFVALQRAGYATDPGYADALTSVQATVEKLAGLSAQPAVPRTLFKGDRGEDVKAVQHALAKAGHYGGKLDGDFGPVTETAVRDFQIARGLVADGIAGPRTLATLGA